MKCEECKNFEPKVKPIRKRVLASICAMAYREKLCRHKNHLDCGECPLFDFME